ncbi:hypothetical protein KV112_18300 [Mycolicibacter sp. MYC123]|uniref:Uncharacterized protein n=1 Tax=[Mycobacterium] zoologicum TaxID=2872311 RepID=A0ABU5YSI1_9MYCO|nr:hypothetical protein [Mycolicibacter sp. MYC123]MEB3051668.1 hypothetical protein [Mycolicibacter sp. MYC123]
MIELVGYRYAVGMRTARTATVLAWVSGLAYLLFGVFWIAGRLDAFTPEVRVGLGRNFAAIYGMALLMTVALMDVLLIADKQRAQVSECSPSAGSRRSRWRRTQHWWSSSDDAAWLRSRTVQLSAAIPVYLYGTSFLSDGLRTAAGAGELGLMAWHWIRLYRLAKHMRTEAARTVAGEVDLYRDFEWDRFDSDDATRFRQRFTDRRWKVPSRIRHLAEAEAYARRARVKGLAYLACAAVAAVVVLAIAQDRLLVVIRASAYDFTHLTGPPSLNPGGGDYLVIALCVALVALPAWLQHQAKELDDLRQIYESCGDDIRAKDAAAESVSAGAATALTTQGTVIGMGRYRFRLQRIRAG